MKFPKLFGRKGKASEAADDYDDLDDDEDVEDLDADSRPTRVIDEDDEAPVPGSEFDDEEDLEQMELEPPALNRRLSPLAIIATIFVAILVVGAFAWWILETDSFDHLDKAETAPPKEVRRVVVDLPPRPAENAPPRPGETAEELTAAETLNAIAAMNDGPDGGKVAKPIQMAAFENLTPAAAAPLARAPDVSLIEQTQIGPLPKTGADGRKPWQVYARPFHAEPGKSRLAVIFTGLGMSPDVTRAAIAYLPADVTLSFDPYGSDLPQWAIKAREAGHEVLLGLPLESARFPALDPGPFALLTSMTPGEAQDRLKFLLSRFTGYTGVLSLMGSRFTVQETHMRSLLDTLRRRGLMYVDAQTTTETRGPAIARELALPYGLVDIELDGDPSATAIDRQLAEFERIAQDSGKAVAIARPYPVTIARVRAWADGLAGKALVLAPASAIAGSGAQAGR